ncbi:CBS domain-containing protein/biotin operon repressor [Sporomusaceae bacterium BoRhaA]|jgi:DeoR family transcriptional regulator, catabolite repression regulator|uniref:CBS domain-containing protein n=1 Tax=Pelorhabdus rhamnosifermentans TaxID=2772457 RepID=UPI001C06393A|nr:CBS domain-containing protein [Pelorhabdus rhamnosifermentans]MBU2701514.1 CBS domain-containing protein/biotin operon repressor [Pelorhabdus rhamnosifermentans]
MGISLTARQEKIVEIVRTSGPIAGEHIAAQLSVTRAALRSDLAILIMSGLIDARPKVGYFYIGKNTLHVIAEELDRIVVGDIQSVPVVVPVECSAYDAMVTLFLEDVGSLYVVEKGGILSGVVSRKDLLKTAMGGSNLAKLPIKVLMTAMPKIVMTTKDEPVIVAAKKLIDNAVDSLPVVQAAAGSLGCYEIVGRLTKTNIARLFVEIGEEKRR